MENQIPNEIKEITQKLIISESDLNKVVSFLDQECQKGLNKALHSDVDVKMYPTYVHAIPNNNTNYEEGKFLALDLGGSNFRVGLVELIDDDIEMSSQMYALPEQLMHESGEKLFDYIADCLAKFMEEKAVKDKKLALGFTFSFPLKQEGLNKATLTQWTKGFKCPGVEGNDVVELLRQALHRRNDIDVEIEAIVNDTTGTLMSCAYQIRDCRVGLVVGTGTNACYVEKVEHISDYFPDSEITVLNPGQVIVNTELGAFGDNGVLDFIRTKWDKEVDTRSKNPGCQLFEKMSSGMYLGEIVRAILVDLIDRELILNGLGSEKMNTPFAFKTQYISEIETDSSGKYDEIDRVLKELDLTHATRDDCEIIKFVCSLVSTRAAQLASAAVATILNRIKRFNTTIAVDGSVYRKHPHFRKIMEETICKLVNPRYKLVLSEDGSGKGAALTASVAVKQRKISREMNQESFAQQQQ
ncbi:Hexokinase-2-like protein [Dinothrombium tinctorium]|uniref:Phosphotransferase n=1 Tax=Dinothrombium tinctorium TaxID=1965070 RepID=A0A3S3P3H8_9ACAR|nr:Hexokinase-2-like protein [Dinothrombium tinctorium]RWS13995.1 Hexokinase-2-like protein [Dinothrombium tinctorium]RWS14033.1 Hexokinase-2-like protein [Dinothrombium tinctorium]